uniref:Trehalose-phosphatase (projected from Caenorhabditis elegans ortholog gob-1) n=1 Tax=Strongyloides venezuelensis TaxID=75913 RepID=A0A0K0FP14_STRVS
MTVTSDAKSLFYNDGSTIRGGQTVEEFKAMMYGVQCHRRKIVEDLIEGKVLDNDCLTNIKQSLEFLNNNMKNENEGFMAEMIISRENSNEKKFLVNLKDEINGLRKDVKFLEECSKYLSDDKSYQNINLSELLRPCHPISQNKFEEELEECLKLLEKFIKESSDGKKPIFVTDWDGTMKDYCSQYATNLQPIYSAICMTQFAKLFTRITAVLTAGPLRGPGILDLTAIPLNEHILFSGSWGREWWINGNKVVHNDGISMEGFNALEQLNSKMQTLIHENPDFSQFALVGSGIQRKVDRLTLGIQTVCNHVPEELSIRYQEAVKEKMSEIDPDKKVLIFDPSTELEVEVVVGNEGVVWNKGNGVAKIVEILHDTLEGPGNVLICGDTFSDIPMVQKVAVQNDKGIMSIFVGTNEKLRSKVRELVNDESRVVFVSCPDVVHAAMWKLIQEHQKLV